MKSKLMKCKCEETACVVYSSARGVRGVRFILSLKTVNCTANNEILFHDELLTMGLIRKNRSISIRTDKGLNNCKQFIIYRASADGVLQFGVAVDTETEDRLVFDK
jgi:hypothetical protein